MVRNKVRLPLKRQLNQNWMLHLHKTNKKKQTNIPIGDPGIVGVALCNALTPGFRGETSSLIKKRRVSFRGWAVWKLFLSRNRGYPQTNMLACFPGELFLLSIYADAFHSFFHRAEKKSHTIRRPVENTLPRSALEDPLDYLYVRWKRWDTWGKFQNAFWHQVSDYEEERALFPNKPPVQIEIDARAENWKLIHTKQVSSEEIN